MKTDSDKNGSYLFVVISVFDDLWVVGKLRFSAFQRRKDHPKRISPRRLVDKIRYDAFSPFGTMAEISWYDEMVRSYLSYLKKKHAHGCELTNVTTTPNDADVRCRL